MIDCPLPYEENDVITSAHGAGGKTMHKFLRDLVYETLGNSFLNTQHDGAILNLNGKTAFSTDSYVVSPAFFPGGNIGDLAVNGTVNDLAMCGAKARYLSLSCILEEGIPVSRVYDVLISVKNAAEYAGVKIVTGDTKVVENGKGDGIYLNTSGIGSIHDRADIAHTRLEEGMSIIVSNDIAAHGMAIMALREQLNLSPTILSDTQPLHRPVLTLLDRFGDKVIMLRDATRGGLATVLNEWTSMVNLGIELEEQSIPVKNEVSSLCEILGIDPLYVANEGVFVMVLPVTVAHEALEIMHTLPECKGASIIGKFTSNHKGKVVVKSMYGGNRVVGMLAGDPLPRIC